jgi:hypothetical protein
MLIYYPLEPTSCATEMQQEFGTPDGRKRFQARIVAPTSAFVLAFRQSYTTEPWLSGAGSVL